ncbi:MAG: MotA/TolQ/ExbB proton channel family protein [Planctomycetota bacterium]
MKLQSFRPFLYLGTLIIVLAFMATQGNAPANAQGTSAADQQPAAAVTPTDTPEEAGIDWMEKIRQGGITMIALGVLSVAGLVFILERLIAVRANHIAPSVLSRDVHRAIESQDDKAALNACEKHPSVLASTYQYIFEHKDNPVETISAGAGDIAGREIRDVYARTYPLAVIASLAPLLGLLGTMIGMIEAFDKVAYYGDDANASLLADSISKALITTAIGLILAIPAIAVYHFFKYRINTLTGILEIEVESIINHLYLKGHQDAAPASAPAASVHAQPGESTTTHTDAP